MTAYEYLDLAQSGTANSISLLTFGFTVLCGYLLIAYAVARKLTSHQVTALTLVYVVAYLFNFAAQLVTIVEIQELRRLAIEVGAESIAQPRPAAMYMVIFIRVSIFIVSLWFMWNVRHPQSQ